MQMSNFISVICLWYVLDGYLWCVVHSNVFSMYNSVNLCISVAGQDLFVAQARQ